MSWNYFYKDRAGGQNGPVSLDELVALATAGRIAPDCLVWPEGGEPQQADKFPELAEVFAGGASRAGPAARGPLIGDFPGWGLMWRFLVYSLGLTSVVFAPFAGRWFYRFIAGRVSLPNGRRLWLDAPLKSCWWIFLGLSLAVVVPAAIQFHFLFSDLAALRAGHAAMEARLEHLWPVRLAGEIVAFVLGYVVILWFVRSLRSEDGALHIAFAGGFWAFLGWNLLIALLLITIVGWAWAVSGMMRWMCRRTVGSHRFEFIGSGWEILWRTFVAFIGPALVLGALAGVGGVLAKHAGHHVAGGALVLLGEIGFLVAIIWTVRWFANWFVGQFIVTPAVAAAEQPAAEAA